MTRKKSNSKTNNDHIQKEEKRRKYDSFEHIKQDIKARKRFEAKPYALEYQKQVEKLRYQQKQRTKKVGDDK